MFVDLVNEGAISVSFWELWVVFKMADEKATAEYMFCAVCRVNHDKGRKHIFGKKHKKNLENIITKFHKKVRNNYQTCVQLLEQTPL